jgi:hypothetical protein
MERIRNPLTLEHNLPLYEFQLRISELTPLVSMQLLDEGADEAEEDTVEDSEDVVEVSVVGVVVIIPITSSFQRRGNIQGGESKVCCDDYEW